MTLFYLGTHMTCWLGRTDVPLFLSHTRLRVRKSFPRAQGPWALDSGGFTELSRHGTWVTTPADYVSHVRRYTEEVGAPDFCATQDWMCEPAILRQTGLTLVEHQRRTIVSYLRLREAAPEIPWLPVLQGWTPADYLRHYEGYNLAGVDARHFGVGTLCRRHGTFDALVVLKALSWMGLRLHGFGFKLTGLRRATAHLASADSMAWSYRARRAAPLAGCTHRSCANCLAFALAWRQRVLQLTDPQTVRVGMVGA